MIIVITVCSDRKKASFGITLSMVEEVAVHSSLWYDVHGHLGEL